MTTIVKMPPASQEPSIASFENWPCQSMSSGSSPGAELKGRGPRGRLAVAGGPRLKADAAEAGGSERGAALVAEGGVGGEVGFAGGAFHRRRILAGMRGADGAAGGGSRLNWPARVERAAGIITGGGGRGRSAAKRQRGRFAGFLRALFVAGRHSLPALAAEARNCRADAAAAPFTGRAPGV